MIGKYPKATERVKLNRTPEPSSSLDYPVLLVEVVFLVKVKLLLVRYRNIFFLMVVDRGTSAFVTFFTIISCLKSAPASYLHD